MKFAKEKTIIGLGILLVVLPLTGFPREWKTVISVVIGVIIIYMGSLFYRIVRNNENASKINENKTQTFTDSI
jgi:type IV secretory pathway VirB2 component (pilin)